MADKRPSWVIRAIKRAFASNPTPETRVSRVQRKYPDYLYSATAGEVERRRLLGRRRGTSGRS